MSRELTSDQKKAEEVFKNWLTDNKKRTTFLLSGYAGSGKTYLSTRLLEIVDELSLCWTAVAPTHKAVGVIRNFLYTENIRPTWHPSTIHRLLRLKVKRKGDIEECKETDLTSQALDQLDLVLVDEASMIDSNLLSITLSCANKSGTRLVFVGDSAQLPPIGESKSPIFTMKNVVTAELNQVVRHRGPVLLLANHFREGTLPCETPPCLPLIKTNQGHVGFLERDKWLKKVQEALQSCSTSNNPNLVRILCYTNKTLENLVPYARRALHGDMADHLPVLPGEVLMSRKIVMSAASIDGADGEEPDILLNSNRELIVEDTKPTRLDLSEFNLEKDENWSIPIIDTYIINARSDELKLKIRILPPANSEPRKLIHETLDRLRFKAKSLEKNKARSTWKKYFLIRDSFAELGPAAVLTIHRSQGSTFKEVFIASDVFQAKDENLRKKLIYVAVSRAKEGVWLISKKNDGYITKIWESRLRER